MREARSPFWYCCLVILMYCRSVSARTLKSEMYWLSTQAVSWLLLPVSMVVGDASVLWSG